MAFCLQKEGFFIAAIYIQELRQQARSSGYSEQINTICALGAGQVAMPAPRSRWCP